VNSVSGPDHWGVLKFNLYATNFETCGLQMRRRDFIAGLGSAVVAPMLGLRSATAQQVAKPVVGFLSNGTQGNAAVALVPFLQGLREQGFVEGRNVEILSRYAESHEDRLPTLAVDLVKRHVAAIFVVPNVGFARIAKNPTATIPILFSAGGDPIESGLVANLNRPDGNVTDATFLTIRLAAKRLEILHQIVPTATSIGYLINPNNPQLEAESREGEAAARSLGVRIVAAKVATSDEIGLAVASLMEQKVGAMLPAADALFVVHADALANRYALPTIYIAPQWVRAGGLISYGGDYTEAHRIAGTYVGRILKGEKPSGLPVQQTTRVEMTLNLKTAKALGLTIPLPLLARVDKVIE
jgi:putative ABC transport system substrate-binding protein